MMDLLALILPPVAVLLCGKPVQALLNLVLALMLWFPGAIHAFLVVHSHQQAVRVLSTAVTTTATEPHPG